VGWGLKKGKIKVIGIPVRGGGKGQYGNPGRKRRCAGEE